MTTTASASTEMPPMARHRTTISRPTWSAAAAKARRSVVAPFAALSACLVLAAPTAAQGSGKVLAWGDNGSGQTTVPAAAAANVKATAAGAHHSLALKEDGSVVAWGHNGNGQTSVPAGLDEAQAIAGGANHSLALSVPAPPGGVGFFEAAPGDRRATLSWVNPTDADYSATRILRSTVGTASGPEPGGSQTQVYEGTAGSHTDTGLTNGQTYYYSAYARDDAGNWSPKAVARVTPADTTRPRSLG